MIGIIGAMEVEIDLLKEEIEGCQVHTQACMDFYKGVLKGKDVVVVRSGVGKVNAAVCTQILADRFGVDMVINTGVAGSLDSSINIGDIVVSTDAVQHDVDAVIFGYQPGEIPQMKKREFEADAKLAELVCECCRRVNPDIGVHTGRVISGDCFVSDTAKKARLREVFGARCTEMEGGAIAQAAWLNNIPFVIVRAISDKADDSAWMDYDQFEAAAARHCARLIMEVAEALDA